MSEELTDFFQIVSFRRNVSGSIRSQVDQEDKHRRVNIFGTGEV
jgi:hypothetical protein